MPGEVSAEYGADQAGEVAENRADEFRNFGVLDRDETHERNAHERREHENDQNRDDRARQVVRHQTRSTVTITPGGAWILIVTTGAVGAGGSSIAAALSAARKSAW